MMIYHSFTLRRIRSVGNFACTSIFLLRLEPLKRFLHMNEKWNICTFQRCKRMAWDTVQANIECKTKQKITLQTHIQINLSTLKLMPTLTLEHILLIVFFMFCISNSSCEYIQVWLSAPNYDCTNMQYRDKIIEALHTCSGFLRFHLENQTESIQIELGWWTAVAQWVA